MNNVIDLYESLKAVYDAMVRDDDQEHFGFGKAVLMLRQGVMNFDKVNLHVTIRNLQKRQDKMDKEMDDLAHDNVVLRKRNKALQEMMKDPDGNIAVKWESGFRRVEIDMLDKAVVFFISASQEEFNEHLPDCIEYIETRQNKKTFDEATIKSLVMLHYRRLGFKCLAR